MKRFGLLLCALFVGCGTITYTPATTKKTRSNRRAIAHHTVTVKKPATVSRNTADVDAEWMQQYEQLKSTHGNYGIRSDNEIRVLPNGKIQVPKTVLKHFEDLSKTPPASPTP